MYLFDLQFYLDICPGVGLLGHMAVLFPVFFKGISTMFSIVAVLVCIPNNIVRGFPFLLPLQHLLFVDFVMIAILNEMVPHRVFFFLFL